MESASKATPAGQVEATRSGQFGSAHANHQNRIETLASSEQPSGLSEASGVPGARSADSVASPPSPTRVAGALAAGTLQVPNQDLTDQEKAIEILRMAGDAFAKTGNWVVFYRDILGVNGIARRTFDSEAKFEQFQKTRQFAELQEMVAALRSQDTSKGDAVEPEKMITIRLPESLHQVLTAEAESMNLSINKLCISKLLQPVEGRFVPVQQGRRRGRRPGPQGSRKKVT